MDEFSNIDDYRMSIEMDFIFQYHVNHRQPYIGVVRDGKKIPLGRHARKDNIYDFDAEMREVRRHVRSVDDQYICFHRLGVRDLVVDLDRWKEGKTKRCGREFYEQNRESISSRTVISGSGGVHIWYRMKPHEVPNSRNNFREVCGEVLTGSNGKEAVHQPIVLQRYSYDGNIHMMYKHVAGDKIQRWSVDSAFWLPQIINRSENKNRTAGTSTRNSTEIWAITQKERDALIHCAGELGRSRLTSNETYRHILLISRRIGLFELIETYCRISDQTHGHGFYNVEQLRIQYNATNGEMIELMPSYLCVLMKQEGIRMEDAPIQNLKPTRRYEYFTVRDVHEIDRPYIVPPIDTDEHEQFKNMLRDKSTVYIRSGAGTGKTYSLKMMIEMWDPSSILSVVSRRTLGICQMRDLDDFGYYERDQPSDRYIVQIDSLLKVKDRKYDLLIIDECTANFCHSLTSNTMSHNKDRYDIMRHYIRLIKSAKWVVVMDANLCDFVYDFIQSIRADADSVCIRNAYQSFKRPLHMYDCIDTLMRVAVDDIIDAIDHETGGLKRSVILVFDTLRRMRQYREFISEVVKSRTDVDINPRISMFSALDGDKMKLIDADHMKNRIIIYNQAVVYGIDLYLPDASTYLFIEGGSLRNTALSLYQTSLRNRAVKAVYAFIDGRRNELRYQSIDEINTDNREVFNMLIGFLISMLGDGRSDMVDIIRRMTENADEYETYRNLFNQILYIDDTVGSDIVYHYIELMKQVGFMVQYNHTKDSRYIADECTSKQYKNMSDLIRHACSDKVKANVASIEALKSDKKIVRLCAEIESHKQNIIRSHKAINRLARRLDKKIGSFDVDVQNVLKSETLNIKYNTIEKISDMSTIICGRAQYAQAHTLIPWIADTSNNDTTLIRRLTQDVPVIGFQSTIARVCMLKNMLGSQLYKIYAHSYGEMLGIQIPSDRIQFNELDIERINALRPKIRYVFNLPRLAPFDSGNAISKFLHTYIKKSSGGLISEHGGHFRIENIKPVICLMACFGRVPTIKGLTVGGDEMKTFYNEIRERYGMNAV